MTIVSVAFWACAGALVYTHLGYPVLLWALTRGRGDAAERPGEPDPLPSVSLIIAAHDEEAVIS